MQNSASLSADQFIELLRRLPPDIDLDALARQTKAIERKRKVETGANLLRLALARGPGGLSLSETAAWATMLGFAQMSDPGVKYRLDKPAPAKAGGGWVPGRRVERPIGSEVGWRQRALGRTYPARGGWDLHQQAWQQGYRLAGACGV
jgi:hypothetical protein